MRKLIALLIAAIVIGGCGPTGDPEGQDWCYRWDFRLDDGGFNIQNGSWTYGYGLLPDETGLLIFNYGHDAFVQANYAIVAVKRPDGVSGDIAVSATGDIFGISATFSTTLPAAMSNYPAIFQPGELGISGNAINVTIQTSQDLYISLIEVRGNGSNPFPVNMCDNSVPLTPGTDTPTPVLTHTATLTATSTLTRTPTATPSISPTPTDDPEPFVCHITGDLPDWTFPTFQGSTSSVSGGEIVGAPGAGGDATFVSAEVIIDASITSVEINFEYTRPSPPPATQLIIFYINGVEAAQKAMPNASGADTILWNGSISGANTFYILGGIFNSGAGHDLRVVDMFITGFGTVPYVDGTGVDCESLTQPTPTPAPTSTPAPATATASITPTGFWTCTFNFANNDGDWISVFNAQWGFSVDDVGAWRAKTVSPKNSLGIRLNASGNMPLRSIRIAGRTYGTRLDDEDELNFRFYNGSSWSTFYQESHNNQAFNTFTSLSRNATQVEIYLSVTQTNVTATEINLVTLQGQGGTNPCSEITTPTATVAQTETPVAGKTGTLTPNPLITSSPRPFTRTPIVLITPNIPPNFTLGPGTPGTGTPPTATAGTPSTAIPGEQIGDETGEIVGFGWQIGWGLFRTLFAWVSQATNDITSLLTSFFTTPPQAIPGLPQCMTRPIEHDICAIYYILDYTLLAPGTPGAIIVPLILILMNFYIFMKFISWVLRLVRRGEAATHVQ